MNKGITKKCNKCLKDFPKNADFFYRNKKCSDGFESQCKACVTKRRRLRYKPIIYKITNNVNGYVYIGQTIKPITERVSKHFSDAKAGRKQPLYIDIRNQSRSDFSFEEIEIITEDLLDEREAYWISKYKEDGINLYNRENGGVSGDIIPDNVRELMAKAKGTKPFLVYRLSGEFVGEYCNINATNKLLGISTLVDMLKGDAKRCGDFVAIFKDNFTKEWLSQAITDAKNTRSLASKGKNNGMYGMRGALNPLSKKIYVIQNDKIIFIGNGNREVQEKFDIPSVKSYSNGSCGHYYKKRDMYFYNENKLPATYSSMRFDKDEPSFH